MGLTAHQAAAADQEEDDADVENVLPHRIFFPRLQLPMPVVDKGALSKVHEELAPYHNGAITITAEAEGAHFEEQH